jgi:hypothetical protein
LDHSVFIPSKNVCWDFLAKKNGRFRQDLISRTSLFQGLAMSPQSNPSGTVLS